MVSEDVGVRALTKDSNIPTHLAACLLTLSKKSKDAPSFLDFLAIFIFFVPKIYRKCQKIFKNSQKIFKSRSSADFSQPTHLGCLTCLPRKKNNGLERLGQLLQLGVELRLQLLDLPCEHGVVASGHIFSHKYFESRILKK